MNQKHMLHYLAELLMTLIKMCVWAIRQVLRLLAYLATQIEQLLRQYNN